MSEPIGNGEAIVGEQSSLQVTVDHYDFASYMTRGRWLSTWHQLDEILQCGAKTVLEIGKGSGVLSALLRHQGLQCTSADINPALAPDCVASVTALPFESDSFDVVVCFQVLEHLPFSEFSRALSELRRVSRWHVIISLPDARAVWSYSIHLPGFGPVAFNVPRPWGQRIVHEFDGQHYWEINKRGYELGRILECLELVHLRVVRTYRVEHYAYHRFFVMSKIVD